MMVIMMENGAVISKDRLCASLCQRRLSRAHNEKWWGPAVPRILSQNCRTSPRDGERERGKRVWGRGGLEEVQISRDKVENEDAKSCQPLAASQSPDEVAKRSNEHNWLPEIINGICWKDLQTQVALCQEDEALMCVSASKDRSRNTKMSMWRQVRISNSENVTRKRSLRSEWHRVTWLSEGSVDTVASNYFLVTSIRHVIQTPTLQVKSLRLQRSLDFIWQHEFVDAKSESPTRRVAAVSR